MLSGRLTIIKPRKGLIRMIFNNLINNVIRKIDNNKTPQRFDPYNLQQFN